MMTFSEKIIEQMGILFEESGTNSIIGRIFGLLLSSDSPLSIGQISEELNLSKASVSINVRMLKNMGYCTKMAVSSDRQHYYKLHDNYLVNAYIQRIERQRRQLDSLMDFVKKQADKGKAIKRLRDLIDFQECLIEAQNKGIEKWKNNHPEKGE